MKTILTSRDIEELAGKGQKEVVIGEDLIITSIAQEIAEKHGIRFITAQEKAGLNNSGVWQTPDLEPLDLLVTNGRLVIPGLGIVQGNISVKNGRILSLSASNQVKAGRVLDVAGRYVIPGVIDPHIHLGLFQPPEAEFVSELKSALAGGITTVGMFLGGNESHLAKLQGLSKLLNNTSEIDMFFHACIMNDLQLTEMDEYLKRGIKSFKFYMCGIPGMIQAVTDEFLIRSFNLLARKPGTMALVHAENAAAVDWATSNIPLSELKTLESWAATHPAWAEAEAVNRAAAFAATFKLPLYFVHISSQEGLAAAQQVRSRNKQVFVETTSPYLTLHYGLGDLGVKGKMSPPIRSKQDNDALWSGCADGSIDTIGTDNTTISSWEKKIRAGIGEAIPGYPVLETHLPSLLDEGIHRRGFDLVRLVELTSLNPAKIFGLFPRKGTLLPGSDADLVVLDLKKEKAVAAGKMYSRSDFSLFEGRRLTGWPAVTIKAGRVVAEGGYYIGEGQGGQVISR